MAAGALQCSLPSLQRSLASPVPVKGGCKLPMKAGKTYMSAEVTSLELEAWQWRANQEAGSVRTGVPSSSFVSSLAARASSGSGAESSGAENSGGGVGPNVRRNMPKPLSALQPQRGDAGQLRVAYQGVPGAYSEAAANLAYPDCESVPCDQFEIAFQAVELWLVDRAVLPIENSLGGSIHRNYDLLLRHRLHIVGEVQYAVNHCLLALPGVNIEDLNRVLSHPQALAQCEGWLSQRGLVREAVGDTAGAAQMVQAENLRDTAAVASVRAGELYGLEVLAEGIQDDADNVTRFLMLAREPTLPRTDVPYKTSIVFTLEEGPGVLFKALAAFALRDINLTKIESRPQRLKPLQVISDLRAQAGTTAKRFDYLFYVDFMASMAETRAQNALRHLQEFAPFLRVLGSYPMDLGPQN